MTIHVYFHRDFDGVCSAAVFGSYVRAAMSVDVHLEFIGVDYDLKDTWADKRLQKPCAIVDFLYHPDADWWFDHHGTTFIRKDWELAFSADTRHVWRTAYRSCPRLIIDATEDSGVRDRLYEQFSEYLYWSDLIDSAAYESPQQIVNCAEPALQINATLSQDRSSEYLKYLVDCFRSLSLAEVAVLKEVQVRYWRARRWQEKAIAYIEKIGSVTKHVAFVDLARHGNLFSRYAVYYLWPHVLFQVAVYRDGASYKLTVSANPWRSSEGPDLGAICERFGGGGHATVAGVLVRSRRRALRIGYEVCRILRGELPFHQQLSFRHVVSEQGDHAQHSRHPRKMPDAPTDDGSHRVLAKDDKTPWPGE